VTRALVTGGAGFIGGHLVDRLVETGFEVAVLDDFSSGRKENLAGPARAARVFEADVSDAEALAAAVDGADLVFHLAARPSVVESVADPLGSHRVNLTGTVAVLEAARRAGVARVVFASSCAVYGDAAPVPAGEDAPLHPASPYALQKAAGEAYCRLYRELHGLESVALRFFNVYGPRQDPRSEYAAVVPRFVAAALAGEPARIFGDGEQTRDFVYVGDVVEALLAAAHVPAAAGAVLNVGSGRRTSVNELCAAVAAAAGTAPAARCEPPRGGELRHSGARVEAAAERLGWRAAVTLERGLRLTVETVRRASRAAAEVVS
jgi:UDP-glucose 4-epimerase